MAHVIHTIKNNQYLYDHNRVGDKVVCTYLYPCTVKGVDRRKVTQHSGFDKQPIKNTILKIKDLKYENGYVFDSTTGKLLKTYKGDSLSVDIDPKDFKLHRNNIYLHNHPLVKGVATSSLSLEDIKTLGHGGFKEMVAVTPTGYKYTLKVTSVDGTTFCLDYDNTLKEKYTQCRKQARNEYTKRTGKFLGTFSKDEELVTHRTIILLMKNIKGLKYTKTKI